MHSGMKIGIIGGGVAGLTAAKTLANSGCEVRVFDKGRGPGGRAARRRETLPDGTQLHFDHGAQYFTARDEGFARTVARWCDRGVAAPWDATLVAIERDSDGARRVVPKVAGPVRYVGVPGMNEIVRDMADRLPAGAEIDFASRVADLTRAGSHWDLIDDQGDTLGSFDTVLCATPPSQAADLLADLPDLAARCQRVEMRPNWALMLAFDAPLGADFDGAFINRQSKEHESTLSWVCRNGSKPGRPDAECWVAHADHRWTRKNLESDREDVPAALLAAFFDAVGVEPREPIFTRAHRWRYALPTAPLGDGCLFDADNAAGACGDWAYGARIEGAYLSGIAAAARVLGQPAAANA
ncbi:MAG: FAD-dependent oxidoreductase [Planctomycetota bacterium]